MAYGIFAKKFKKPLSIYSANLLNRYVVMTIKKKGVFLR